MKRPQLVSQGTLTRILQSAEQAWNNRSFQESIELLERASRLDPANTRVLVDLGNAYGMRFDYAAAERCFEKAIRLAPKKAEMLAAIGMKSRHFANPKLAALYFEQAIQRNDATPETFVRLAEIYERLRRVPEATAVVERALKLNSDFSPALLVKARLERQAGRLNEAEKLLRSFLDKADRETRVRGFYELGGILDRLGRYD